MLFQIVDDILDVTGTDDALGKPQGQRRAPRQAHLRQRVRPRRARELAAESHRKARAALAEASDRGDRTQELEQITDFIATRTS